MKADVCWGRSAAKVAPRHRRPLHQRLLFFKEFGHNCPTLASPDDANDNKHVKTAEGGSPAPACLRPAVTPLWIGGGTLTWGLCLGVGGVVASIRHLEGGAGGGGDVLNEAHN